MAFRWWRGGFPKFPYTNFHEANLDYFLSVFSEIWTEWEEMYNKLTAWKEQTDIDFQTWRDGVETALNDWKTNFEYRNTIWQNAMETNISDWESDVLSDLDSWKDEFIESYNDIETRVESIVSDTEDMIENLAEPFDSTKNYVVNDYVIYEGILYRFISPHTAGDWNSSEVTQSTAMEDIKDLKNNLNAVAPNGYDFTWTIGKQVDATGSVATQSHYACTNAVPAYPGDMIKYTGPARDADQYRLYLQVCQYQDNTLLSRTDISQSTELIISSNCNNIRLSYGSGSSAPDMTQERLDTYYSALFYRKSVPITDVLPVFDTINRINKNIAVTYESGTWGKATERFNIYMPATSGYLLFRLYHYINNDNNCNCWQITNVYHVDENLSNAVQLTIDGEWECAIRLDGRDDFSGGHTHGNEVINNDITIICDNVPVVKSDFSTKKECNNIRLVRTSVLYDPEDNITQIANHGVEYIFDRDNGLIINQSIKWKVAESLKNCYLAMFTPSKNYIDRGSANSDFEILELPSTTGTPLTTIVKNNATDVTLWDTSSGFFADVSIPIYPTGLTGGDRASLEDNGNLDYNKLYFKVCNGATSTIDELWKSTTIYKLDYIV